MIKPDNEYYIVNSFFKLTRKGYELIIYQNGDKYYYLNGQLHRENAPAISNSSGYQVWWNHHKYHRLNGPAIIHPNGTKEYWIDNKEYEEDEFCIIQKKCFKCYQIFNNLYELKIHLEKYSDTKNMINYIYDLLLK